VFYYLPFSNSPFFPFLEYSIRPRPTKVNIQNAQRLKFFFVQYSDLQSFKIFAIIISENEREIQIEVDRLARKPSLE